MIYCHTGVVFLTEGIYIIYIWALLCVQGPLIDEIVCANGVMNIMYLCAWLLCMYETYAPGNEYSRKHKLGTLSYMCVLCVHIVVIVVIYKYFNKKKMHKIETNGDEQYAISILLGRRKASLI